ncbi:MAG: NusA-like transcription termination signal-binding factor [Candidatus Diapherotrites archaeon]|nr:NusA-like transcription termination signal-binding factor [Candidatus Diapherotrites archaeon]
MKLGLEEIMLMNALEKISGVGARDCIVDGSTVSFLVWGKDVGRAIGKGAQNVKRLSERLGKKIEIVEYSKSPERFFKKALAPMAVEGVESRRGESGKAVSVRISSESRRTLMESKKKVARVREIAKRNYGFEEVRIR